MDHNIRALDGHRPAFQVIPMGMIAAVTHASIFLYGPMEKSNIEILTQDWSIYISIIPRDSI